MRSATWAIGKKLKLTSSSSKGADSSWPRSTARTFAWEIIAPLGGPVVPLVYTRIAVSSGVTACTRSAMASSSGT